MSEQDGKIVNLGGLKKFKEHYDTDIITPINNKINSKTNVQSGEIITTNNDTIGYFKNIKINGNTRYKKSDKTYTDTWESGVSLESVGEAEKNSDGKYPIEVFSCNGENLMRRTVFEKSHADYTLEDGRYTVSGDSSFNWAHVSFVIDNLVVGAEYVCSCFIESSTNKSGIVQLVDGNNKTLIFTRYAIGNVGESFIATSPTMYLRLFANNDEYNGVKRYSNVIVSKKHNKRTILLDSPLRKVGEVSDILDLDNSQITRKCKTITIDGSSDENWVIETFQTPLILFYCKITENAPKNYDIHLISDKFSSFRYDTMWGNTNEGISVSNNILRINISKSKLETQDVAGFKKWLQSNPVTVVYQLATPTTEDIEVSSNTLTDFATSCTLTIGNTIKGNIECNEVVGLIPSVEENGTRLANVEKSLENKAEKNHNHDNSYLKLSGGTMTGTIGFPQGVGIESATNAGKGLLKETSTSVNVGFTGKSIRLYGSSISYNDSSGNKYDIYHSGNLRVGGVNNIVNGGFTNGTNGYKPNENTTLTIVDDSASYTGKALKLICPKSNGGIFRWVSSASDSTKTTISFYAKKDSATSSLSITFGFEGIKMANAPLTDKWQRFALTIDAQQGQMLIYTLGAGTFFIHSIKVESGDRYTDWNYANQELVTTKDITTLFERNNGTINKNINTCFASSSGTFTAPEAGQYLVMCSGYKLSNSNMYIACVVGGENSNRNELYTTGSSGFTLITLSAKQTLMLYECPTGNISNTCISSNSAVNMLIARIK